jgi:outer membrane autotransporter protein
LVALSTDNTPQGRAAYAKALGSLDAETVESGALSALQADTVAASTIDNRTAELRGQYGFSGAMAGDPMAINGFWAQGYGNETDQGIRDGVDGFDADTYGVGMGLDAPVGERMVVGLAFSYADTEVTMKQESNNGMDIGSYRLSAYGSYNADNYYLDGQLAYAMNDYETERAISPLLGSSLIAKGQHDGDQYNVRVRGGYPMATESGWFVTPIAEVNYTFLSEDKYSETGAGNLGLVLDANDVEVLVLSVGVKAAYPITTENEITWIPEVSLNYAYDTIGDEVEVDSNFVGVTGAAFITTGANVEQQAIKASFKIRTFSQGNFSFAAGYDYVDKADYDSQSLTATVRYDF